MGGRWILGLCSFRRKVQEGGWGVRTRVRSFYGKEGFFSFRRMVGMGMEFVALFPVF